MNHNVLLTIGAALATGCTMMPPRTQQPALDSPAASPPPRKAKNVARPNGMQREWYHNGQLAEASCVVDGRPAGVWRRWYIDGTLKEERVYGQMPDVCAKKDESITMK